MLATAPPPLHWSGEINGAAHGSWYITCPLLLRRVTAAVVSCSLRPGGIMATGFGFGFLYASLVRSIFPSSGEQQRRLLFSGPAVRRGLGRERPILAFGSSLRRRQESRSCMRPPCSVPRRLTAERSEELSSWRGRRPPRGESSTGRALAELPITVGKQWRPRGRDKGCPACHGVSPGAPNCH